MPRAITFHLVTGTPAEVGAALVGAGFEPSSSEESAWLYPSTADPKVFVWLLTDYTWIQRDLPEEFDEIVQQLHGRAPLIRLHVEVSGRVPGHDLVRHLARVVLTSFEGCAVDEVTPEHGWSLTEIEAGVRVGGAGFFEYSNRAEHSGASRV